MRESHEFALFVSQISNSPQQHQITDQDLVKRVSLILRLSPGEELILFDEHAHLRCKIINLDKKSITILVLEKFNNKKLKPAIHWLLPVLEKESFEESLYTLTAMGATSVQPIITQKVKRSFGKEKEIERIQRIMIAAAEQSKQFALPALRSPSSLSDALGSHKSSKNKIFFDAAGQSAFETVSHLRSNTQEIICLIGPEGDLTFEEKELAKSANFTFCTLTPTILRAEQAVTVGMGILRSLL